MCVKKELEENIDKADQVEIVSVWVMSKLKESMSMSNRVYDRMINTIALQVRKKGARPDRRPRMNQRKWGKKRMRQ